MILQTEEQGGKVRYEKRKGRQKRGRTKTKKENNNKRIRKTWVMGRREAMERFGNRYAM